jgi:hypothetical protein
MIATAILLTVSGCLEVSRANSMSVNSEEEGASGNWDQSAPANNEGGSGVRSGHGREQLPFASHDRSSSVVAAPARQ